MHPENAAEIIIAITNTVNFLYVSLFEHFFFIFMLMIQCLKNVFPIIFKSFDFIGELYNLANIVFISPFQKSLSILE